MTLRALLISTCVVSSAFGLLLSSPAAAQAAQDGDMAPKPAGKVRAPDVPKIDPADIGKSPINPGDDVSWRPPVIPPLVAAGAAPDTDTSGGKPPVSPGDSVSWRPPVIPPLAAAPLSIISRGTSLSGVWQVHAGLNADTVLAEAVADPDSSGWSSLYIKFDEVSPGTFKGYYVHPTISGRAAPNCPYATTLMARVVAPNSGGAPVVPVVTIDDDFQLDCTRGDLSGFQAWTGSLLEAGTVSAQPVVRGTAHNSNGNWLYFVLAFDPVVSAQIAP